MDLTRKLARCRNRKGSKRSREKLQRALVSGMSEVVGREFVLPLTKELIKLGIDEKEFYISEGTCRVYGDGDARAFVGIFFDDSSGKYSVRERVIRSVIEQYRPKVSGFGFELGVQFGFLVLSD